MSQISKNSGGGGGGGDIQTIAGDVGSITGTNVTIYANNAANNSGSTVAFNNSGTTSTLNVTDSGNNTFIGSQAGKTGVTGTENTALGKLSCTSITSGDSNTAVGFGALASTTVGNQNTAVGASALSDIGLTSVSNTSIGFDSLSAMTSGNSNCALGSAAGSNCINGNSNIWISNNGIASESNTIKIGTQGSGAGQQDTCFIAGINGNTVSNAEFVTIDNVTGQLGTTTSPGGSSVYFSTYLSAPTGNVTGDNTLYGPILFDGILSNVGAAYSAGTGLFTAPTTGIYSFTHTIALLGGDAATTSYLTIWNGSAFGARAFQLSPTPQAGSNTTILSACIIIPMTAGDTMGVQVLVAGTSLNMVVYGAAPTGVPVTSLFSGFKVA